MNDNPVDEDPPTDSIFDEEERDKKNLAAINFDLADSGRLLLKVIGGPNHGAEFSLHTATTYVIGTDPNSCDIIFHDTSVSRQQVRVTVDKNDEMTIEDLKSRNGTFVEGEAIKGKKKLAPNAVINVGTTTFTIYDREGKMQTIISPLLPAIVKVLQKEEPKKPDPAPSTAPSPPLSPKEEIAPPAYPPAKTLEKNAHTLGAFIVIGIITGLFAIIGFGMATLFKSEQVQMENTVDINQMIETALKPFPSIKPYFNSSTGKLQLIGHVTTLADKTRLVYSLEGLRPKYIKEIDDSNVIIDEGVWRELNQALSKNPNWKGISVYAPIPGKFVLSGQLQTRRQAEQLYEYIMSHFHYVDLLEKNIVVEEDVINSATKILQNAGIRELSVQMTDGTLTVSGSYTQKKSADLRAAIGELQKIPGVRNVRNFSVEVAPEEATINISDKYEVTGVSRQGNNYSIVIHGHILTKGDELDGMIIKEIRSTAVFLEKDGIHYRIDFNK